MPDSPEFSVLDETLRLLYVIIPFDPPCAGTYGGAYDSLAISQTYTYYPIVFALVRLRRFNEIPFLGIIRVPLVSCGAGRTVAVHPMQPPLRP